MSTQRAPVLPGLGRLPRSSSPVLADEPGSDLERILLAQLRAAGLQEPVREYRFALPRRWRFDFAWPSLRIAVEADGGLFLRSAGRHTRPTGFAKECEKRRAAALAGWAVLEFTEREVKSGRAAREIGAAVRARRQAGHGTKRMIHAL